MTPPEPGGDHRLIDHPPLTTATGSAPATTAAGLLHLSWHHTLTPRPTPTPTPMPCGIR
ncbi:hypothetical protein I551_8441 [Mycobacterium ulcerans str. Harvey]|uniref:Uncharacterized protein n=1 Tax=Mycobacterium ulcerans str. Harvey TaxID=1299332 RepID=A0ABN0RAY5_MYCUL|nr:hypothetical protein I551_8441 [Mycobacterium ulcerans str. Harvey]